MIVRIPIARSWSKRTRMPSLTTSLSSMTPSTWLSRATASGVEPWRAIRSSSGWSSCGARPPSLVTQRRTASPAPLRRLVPLRSTPLIRVSAVKGTKRAWAVASSCSRSPYCLASTTIERPSGVSSARDESCAASASWDSSTPGIGMNADAWRLPSVIVPVLSSSSTSTSPEASTARPDRASTLRRTRRSMPAIPIADSSAPIVVGMRATSSEISVAALTVVSAKSANGRSAITTARKISVSPASRMPSAISFGVLRRSAPSTSAIIRSRKLWPGSWVISTTIRSDSTRVPPVTAERSPPASRMTGADSPVIADSSTEAMPSMTVPSPGIGSPASTTTTSPRRSSPAARWVPSASVAIVSLRIARRVAACALPRPSAIASAKLPNSTVSHSQAATVNVYQAGSDPFPGTSAPNSWITHRTVVTTAPTSTTNMTGLAIMRRGSSLRTLSTSAGTSVSGANRERCGRSVIDPPPAGARG